MATTGGSNIEITADSRQATRSLGTFFRNLENSGRRVSRAMNNINPFDRIEREANRLSRTIGRPMENLPDHLQPFREQITEVRTELNQLGRQGGQSLDSLARSAVRSSVAADRLTSVTSSGREAAEVVRELTEETRTAQLAVMGLNEDGTIAIDTDESQRRLSSFRNGLDQTRRRLEDLRDAGDMGSYVAGMRQVEMSLADVDRSLQATARGGQQYTRMLRDMGIYTSDTANQMAIDMERYRGQFMRNIDMMNSRTTLSRRMMDFLPETSRIQALDRFFLNIGNRLEQTAQRGTAANLAIEMLGRNAPMKKIMDLTRMITQGVMGVQQLAITSGIIFAGFTAIMAKAAYGPDPADIKKSIAKITDTYYEEFMRRKKEIFNAWDVFAEVKLEFRSPEKLIGNLQSQMDILSKLNEDLLTLDVRIRDRDVMEYLRELGPEAAAEISTLNDMTDQELTKWVNLWKEKNRLAHEMTITSMQRIREDTDRQIQQMKDSIQPLAIAWEEFVQAWAKAMGPFVKTWGIVAAKVVDGTTAIGNFINKLNELTPQLTAAGGMFLYLFTGLTLILAPLGVGIGLIKGMRANFSALFLMIKPGVVAFLRVAGAATAISAALVALGLVFYNLWTNSERLRDVLTTAFTIIKAEILGAVNQIKPEFAALRDAFNDMVEQFLGKGNTLKDVWGLIGDTVAEVLSDIMTNYLPAFKAGLANMVNGAKAIIGFLIESFKMMHSWWKENGPAIISIVTTSFEGIKTVLSEVIKFIGMILSQIVGFFKSDGAQILEAVQNIFGFILKVIQFIMPAVLMLIETIWKNIKGVINGALNVIMGAVKIFSGLFTGDFNKMWEGIKQLFFGAIEFIINFVSLTFFGKILGGVRIFVTAFRSGLGAMWEAVKMLFKGGGSVAFSYIKRAWDDMLVATRTIIGNVTTYIKNTWDSIKSISAGLFNAVKTIFTTGWNSVANATSFALYKVGEFIVKIFNTIKNFIGNSVLAYYNTVDKAWKLILGTTKTVFTSIFNTTKSIFTGIFNFFKSILSAIWTFIVKMVDNIWITFSAGWRNIKVSTETVFRTINTFLRSIFTAIRDFISATVGGISSRISSVWNGIKRFTETTFMGIFNAVKNRFNDIVTAAKALPGKIGDGIKSMAGKVTGGITAVINAMARTLGKGMNGVIKGLNWVLNKLGVNIEIAQWDVPQYARGTKGNGAHPGGPMVVGDGKGSNAGPELIETPDGKQMLSPSKPTLMHGPKGTKVWSATETKKILAMVPHYAWGDLKKKARAASEWVADKYNAGKEKVQQVGSKIKNTALDVMSYVKSPGKLLDVALKTLGINKPSGNSFAANVAKGGWSKVKSHAVNYVKEKLAAFASTQSGIALTGGNGGGFGAPFRFTSGPGPRDTGIAGASTYHKGWDWAAPTGTPIPSASNGVVSRTGYHHLSGNFIEVRSGNKVHRYQHNSRNALSTGQDVRKGQTVGYVGSTGVSSGPHLHYEVKGYAKGGLVKMKQLAWIAEKGMEAIIPMETDRARGINLWRSVGEHFGFDMDALMNPQGFNKEIAGGTTSFGNTAAVAGTGLASAFSSFSQNGTGYTTAKQPMIVQTVLSDGRVIAEAVVDDISELQGGGTRLNKSMRGG